MSKILSEPDRVNYLAIGLLERFGNASPSQKQIDEAETLIDSLLDLVPNQTGSLQNFYAQHNFIAQVLNAGLKLSH